MSRVARFKVYGDFDKAHGATVEINRDNNLFTVRPTRRRKTYSLPLDVVARRVMSALIIAEVAEKKAAKKKKFLARRGLLR